MDNSGTSSPEGRDSEGRDSGGQDDRVDGLVRPYVAGPGDIVRRPLELPAADDTGWYIPAPLSGEVIEPPSPAGQHRTDGTGTHRRLPARRPFTMIAVVAGVVAFASCAFLLWPHSSPATLASKCQPVGCQQIAPQAPITAFPLTLPSSPSTRPRVHHSTRRTVTAAARTPSTTTSTAPSTVTGSASTPASATPSPVPGSRISVRATTACCTSFYIRHNDDNNQVVITQITSSSSATTKADATWIVQAGLADRSCISFESANEPGQYLRHFDFELYLEPNDGSSQFALDATFCPRQGNSGQGYSFESVNYPDKYIRHFDYVVYIASNGGWNPWDTPRLWVDDTTWDVTQPWG